VAAAPGRREVRARQGDGAVTERLTGAIYGQILVTAIVATLSEEESISASDILVGVVVTMLVFWLAHVYARAEAMRLTRTEGLTVREVAGIAAEEWPMVQAAIPAVVFLVLGWAGVLSRDMAIDLAVAAGVVALAGWGFLIARRSRMSLPGTVGTVALNCGLGLAIVGLKIAVH
jgi:hypothetical protein